MYEPLAPLKNTNFEDFFVIARNQQMESLCQIGCAASSNSISARHFGRNFLSSVLATF